MIWSDMASDEFKLFSGQMEADLLIDFTHDTIQECLIAFASATKKVKLSRIGNAREVVA